jgi:hypothetical protein
MSTSSPVPQSEVLVKTIQLLKLALQAKQIKLLQFNQKQEVLNLLIQVPDDMDPAQIASMIWAIDAQLKVSQISLVKLYKQVEGKSNPELFSSIDFTQLAASEDNPFPDSPPIESKISYQNVGQEITTSAPDARVNPNLGVKHRAQLGDLQAIKQLLDLALIHKNKTTIVRLEGKKLIVIIPSEGNVDQQTVVMAIKRQLQLLNSSVFNSVEIKSQRSNEDVFWAEEIYFKTLDVQTKHSGNLALKERNQSIGSNFILISALILSGIVGRRKATITLIVVSILATLIGGYQSYRDEQDAIEREEMDVIEALQVVNDGLDDHRDGEYLPTWIMTSRRIAGEELEDLTDSENYNLIERVYIVHVAMIGLQLCGKDPVMGAEKDCLDTMYSIILNTEIDGKLLFPATDPVRSLIYRSDNLVFSPYIDRHKVYDRLNQVRRNDRVLLNSISY